MKHKLILAVLPAIVLLLSIGSCKKKIQCVDGNGDFVQETRILGQFNSVKLYGGTNLFFSSGSDSRVDIFAESNIVPLITTAVDDQKILLINVKSDACYNASQTPEVTLMSPDCYEFMLFGSGKLEAHGINRTYYKISSFGTGIVNSSFNTNKFIIESQGSGDANLAGSTTTSLINLFGSGNIYSRSVTSDTCMVISEGSGDITVTVKSFLVVTIKGSGNVYYTGDPNIKSNITGSGKLIQEGK